MDILTEAQIEDAASRFTPTSLVGRLAGQLLSQIRCARSVHQKNSTQFSLSEYVKKHNFWSRNSFGVHSDPRGLIKHIIKECDEVLEDPTDGEEWVDIIILAIDGFNRCANEATCDNALEYVLQVKQQKNMTRSWPKNADPGEPVEHIRTGEEKEIASDQPSPAKTEESPTSDQDLLVVIKEMGKTLREAERRAAGSNDDSSRLYSIQQKLHSDLSTLTRANKVLNCGISARDDTIASLERRKGELSDTLSEVGKLLKRLGVEGRHTSLMAGVNELAAHYNKPARKIRTGRSILDRLENLEKRVQDPVWPEANG